MFKKPHCSVIALEEHYWDDELEKTYTGGEAGRPGEHGVGWQSWYRFFPWEDWRADGPALVRRTIAPLLAAWARTGSAGIRRERRLRAAVDFGLDGQGWNDELVLQR